MVLTIIFLISFSKAELKLTIYDDGLSCPSNCDSHVVFHKNLNGTQYAHQVNFLAPNFTKCSLNSECEICFND